MNYSIEANSISNVKGVVATRATRIDFGTTAKSTEEFSNPAEIFLSAFAACVLKNVERFSKLMRFDYSKANIKVTSMRQNKPPKMDDINYELLIYSEDEKLNLDLLKKNIENHGTIYNTIKSTCSVKGNIKLVKKL